MTTPCSWSCPGGSIRMTCGPASAPALLRQRAHPRPRHARPGAAHAAAARARRGRGRRAACGEPGRAHGRAQDPERGFLPHDPAAHLGLPGLLLARALPPGPRPARGVYARAAGAADRPRRNRPGRDGSSPPAASFRRRAAPVRGVGAGRSRDGFDPGAVRGRGGRPGESQGAAGKVPPSSARRRPTTWSGLRPSVATTRSAAPR